MVYQREISSAYSDFLPVAHFYFDAPADIPDLPTLDHAAPGSDAYCVGTQDVYILSSDGTWVMQ
jgi:hypothetical protein